MKANNFIARDMQNETHKIRLSRSIYGNYQIYVYMKNGRVFTRSSSPAHSGTNYTDAAAVYNFLAAQPPEVIAAIFKT